MEIRELRIGNKLFYFIGEDGLEWEETTIDWQDIKECTENPDEFNKNHKPIPLTEEWLLKLGLEKIQEGYFEHFEIKYWNRLKTVESKVQIRLERMDDYYMGIWMGGHSIVHIYSVHRLQNLYFALTGEELAS